jgi:hypothetical protein
MLGLKCFLIFDFAPVRRVLHGTEADIYSFNASGQVNASFFWQMYGNYYNPIARLGLSTQINHRQDLESVQK